jgi:hypothetical protein
MHAEFHAIQIKGIHNLFQTTCIISCHRECLEVVILPVVFCGCETGCVTLREEHRLRVFGNRVLRRIIGT